MKKWIIGLACGVVGVTTVMGQYSVNFEGTGETKTAYASATVSLSGKNWDMTEALIGTADADWKNGLRSARMRGYGISSMTLLEDIAEGIGTISFQYRRYGTDSQVDWKVEYSTDSGGTWTQVGNAFTAPASDVVQTFSESINSTGGTRLRIKRATESGTANARLNIDDITMTTGGPAVFSVSVDKTDGFEVDQGSSAAITATAANGTEPYSYSWNSTLGASFYTAVGNVFTILATAPVGDYSATVTATDATPQSTNKTVTFSVVAPAPKYAITITAPVNGTVTTTPETEAEAGQTVTINATPAGGYAVGTITVVDAGMNPVTVTLPARTFTMPAAAVTVTVTFVEHTGSSLIISEVADPSDNLNARFVELYNAGGSAVDLAAGQWYLARQANGGTWANVALTGTVAPAATYVIIYSASNFAAAYPTVTPNQTAGAVVTGNGDDGYFLYSGGNNAAGILEDAYGVLDQDGTGTPWEYEDARAFRNASITAGNQTWTASEWTIQDPAGVTDMTPGVHPEGAAVFSVSVDKTDGFTVDQGSSAVITATAANGAEPYSYSWQSTLGATYYTAEDNVFTILATAPVGDYSATVTATDATPQSTNKTVTFSVVVPAQKYAINITAPVNGTVTTTPATEAEAGQTVTINATPAGGYAVGTITVVDAGMNPVTVTLPARTFTMPAAAVSVTVTFDVLSDTATLPTSFTGPGWYQGTGLPSGWTQVGLGTDYATSLDTEGAAAKFDTTADSLQIKYDSAATELTYWLQFNGTWTNSNVFKVQESVNGAEWTDLVVYDDANPISGTKAQFTNTPNASSRYIKFIYVTKGSGNVGLDGVAITGGGAALPGIKFEAAGALVDENIGGLPIMVYKTLPEGDVSGTIVLSGTATPGAGADYTVDTTNFTMNGATTSAMFVVTVNDDALAESSETIILTLANVTGGTVVAPSVFTMTITDNDGAAPTVVITGDLSVTVDVEMGLSITLQNGTAADWIIDLKDPDGMDDYSYGWNPGTGAFTLTPAKVGNYTLTATALNGGGGEIDSDTVIIVVSPASGNPPITGITFVLGTGFTFQVPNGYSLVRVEGADTVVAGNVLTWLPLNSPTDYELSGTTVTIKSAAAMRRLIRIVVQ